MFWFIGFVIVVAVRVYLAGKTDFTYGPGDRWHNATEINENKVWAYGLHTMGIALFWPVVLPCYGLYKLGQKRK